MGESLAEIPDPLTPEENWLRINRDGDVLRIVLNRPRVLNALIGSQLEELREVIANVTVHDAAAITIEGAGDRAFSAGFDLKAIAAKDPQQERRHGYLQEVIEAIRASPVPVIALINGHCTGSAFDLALACDIRIATPSVRIRMPAAALGAIYAERSVVRFTAVLGEVAAKELFLLGCEYDAERALRTGAVQEVVPFESLQDAALLWLEKAGRREAVAAHKRIINSSLDRFYGSHLTIH